MLLQYSNCSNQLYLCQFEHFDLYAIAQMGEC